MRNLLLLIGIPALMCSTAALAAEDMGFGAPVSDDELSSTYGKFLLPNGVDLAMSVQSDTAVDGHLLLRSVLSVDQGATLTVYAPPAGSAGPVVTMQSGSSSSAATTGGATGVSVLVDRNGITTVNPTYGASGTPGVNVSVDNSGTTTTTGAPATSTTGLVQVAATPNGSAVTTGGGAVSTVQNANGYRVELDANGLSINQLAGRAIGTVIANSVSNRVIDSVTSVQLSLHNTQQVLAGSAALKVNDLATAAAIGMIR